MLKNSTITVIGLGSLLSEVSARRTCPGLTNFRLAYLEGYKRVFNKTDSVLARAGKIPKDRNDYACLSAVPDANATPMAVSAFEIPSSDWLFLVQREFEYKLWSVPFRPVAGEEESTGVLCVGNYECDEECEIIVNADPVRKACWEAFRLSCDEPMWRFDLLPNPEYLKRCLTYASKHGSEVLDNFLDTTFTGQGMSIRDHLKTSGLVDT